MSLLGETTRFFWISSNPHGVSCSSAEQHRTCRRNYLTFKFINLHFFPSLMSAILSETVFLNGTVISRQIKITFLLFHLFATAAFCRNRCEFLNYKPYSEQTRSLQKRVDLIIKEISPQKTHNRMIIYATIPERCFSSVFSLENDETRLRRNCLCYWSQMFGSQTGSNVLLHSKKQLISHAVSVSCG